MITWRPPHQERPPQAAHQDQLRPAMSPPLKGAWPCLSTSRPRFASRMPRSAVWCQRTGKAKASHAKPGAARQGIKARVMEYPWHVADYLINVPTDACLLPEAGPPMHS
jgi:hypothetical protein